VSRSALRTSRLLQRSGTIAATATALVLAGSGLALGATSNDATTGTGTNPVTTALQPVTSITGLAPNPSAQSAPTPSLPKPVSAVVKTVTTTVQGLTKTTPRPPTPSTPSTPVTPNKAGTASVDGPTTIGTARKPGHPGTHAAAAVSKPRLPLREDAANLKPMNDMAFQQKTGPVPAQPQLAPATTSSSDPLADLPDIARHVLPMAFVVAAAAIIACLAAGHLGLWYDRRMAQI
jgi:hypothetical protein